MVDKNFASHVAGITENFVDLGDGTHARSVNVNSPPVTVFTVGTNTYTYMAARNLKLIFAHVTYTSSATVGDRKVVLQLVDASANVVADWHTTPVIAASLTRHIEFNPGTYREAAFDANNSVQTPFAIGLIVPSGYSLKILDSAGIHAGDSMIIGLQFH